MQETDRINLCCVFAGAHTSIKRNKPEEAETINQYSQLMLGKTVYHRDNKGSKALNSAVKCLVIARCDDLWHICLIIQPLFKI